MERIKSAVSSKASQSSSMRNTTMDLAATPIEVFPPEIFLNNIEQEQTYEVNVVVRNLTSKVRRIRFIPPNTSKFTAEYETLGAIAAGIATKVKISFETEELGNYHDELIIVSDNFRYVLQLHAFVPGPDIQFEPFVNLGFSPLDRPKSHKILFRNEGDVEGAVSLKYDQTLSPEIVIEPAEFIIAGMTEAQIDITYQPKDPGIFRCLVEVHVTGQDKIRYLDVNATCVEHQVSIVAPNMEKIPPQLNEEGEPIVAEVNYGTTTVINFGSMYHGQSNEIVAYLVNNGPVSVPFNVNIMKGSEDDVEHTILNNPKESAQESIKQVMIASPSKGAVEAYSQFPIKFTCHSKVIENPKGFIHNMMEEQNPAGEINQSFIVDNIIDYFYTASFKFGKFDFKLNLQLQARAILPNVKILTNSINFGDCNVHDTRDFLLTLENMNEEIPLEYEFDRIAHFTVAPRVGKLLPLQNRTINATFKPNNFGVFSQNMLLKLIKGAYKVPIKMTGKSVAKGDRVTRTRGPGSTAVDFQPDRKYITDQPAAAKTVGPSRGIAGMFAGTATIQDTYKTDYSEKVDQAMLNKFVKQKAVDFLRQTRADRLKAEMVQKFSKVGKFIPYSVEEIEADVDIGLKPTLKPTKMALPKSNEPLVVDRPLGNVGGNIQHTKEHKHDADKQIKNAVKKHITGNKFEEVKFSLRPSNQTEVSECQMELIPAELERISAGPKIIDYNKLVVRSESIKTFSVVNDLARSILIELDAEGFEEISAIKPPSLVIPPGKTGGFNVHLLSGKIQNLSRTIAYRVNGAHEFNFLVNAIIEPAILELSKGEIDFAFDDDNMEECISETILVENKTNSQATFEWIIPEDCSFDVNPERGHVEPYGHTRVNVTYWPVSGGLAKTDEETLTLKVENGDPRALKVRGEINEVKCINLQRAFEFGDVCVGVREERFVTIRNASSGRTNAIFHMKNYPHELQIAPYQGKILPEAKVNLKAIFCSQEEKEINTEIEVGIRGGKSILLPVTANAIIPNVYIDREEVDFGGVTCGNSSTENFLLVNESCIDAIVYIDLREHLEFEIGLGPGGDALESNVLVPATIDVDSPFYDKDDDDLDINANEAVDEEEDSENEDDSDVKIHKITVPKETSVPLALKFTPSNTEAFLFDMPMIQSGINRGTKGITKAVSGEGLKPRFLMDPVQVDFQEKVITHGEKSFAVHKNVMISNPDSRSLFWKADISSVASDKIFSIKPTEGEILSGESFNLTVSFNPPIPDEYEGSIDFYLDNQPKAYITMYMKGKGTIPRIVFDRREILLPITPLNIQAKTSFSIMNQGYENIDLRFKLPHDVANLPIQITFPEGNSLGVTKQKCTCDVTFQYNKPMSFTANIDFLDDDGKPYPISVSGTTDNSMLTCLPFIQRNADEIVFETQEGEPIVMKQEVCSDEESMSVGKTAGWGGTKTSGASSVMSRSAKSMVGYNPIPIHLLEKGLENIMRWVTSAVHLSTTISKFPDDIIASNGQLFYEIVFAVSGKMPPGLVKNIATLPKKEVVTALVTQYEEVLTYLKIQGAVLNTVRPEFLLSMQDFSRYLTTVPYEHAMLLRQKQIERRWPYLSMDSWTNLMYQVFKIYLLNRVNAKSFRALAGMDASAAAVDHNMSHSNIFTLSENILLKWMSHHYAKKNILTPKRCVNFDADLADGQVLAAIIQSHCGNVKALQSLRNTCNNEDQRLSNCEKVIQALSEIGISTHVSAKDLADSAYPRETILLLVQLYQTLPNYIPKCAIVFTCTLGDECTKNIELNNPANKPINYWINIEGSTDFFCEEKDITLPPKQGATLNVTFRSRISQEVSAKLSLTSRHTEGTAQAAAMVFDLKSQVTQRRSEEQIEVESFLYENHSQDIDIFNKFNLDAEFTISLSYPKQEPVKKGKTNQRKGAEPSTKVEFPPAFFIKNERIKVKKKSGNYISLQFLPFELENTVAYLSLVDERVGELQYTITGVPKPPRVDKGDKKEFTCYAGDSSSFELFLPAKNMALEKARSYSMERVSGPVRVKERDQLKEIFKNMFPDDPITYEILMNSPFYACPNSIVLHDVSKRKAAAGPSKSPMDLGSSAGSKPEFSAERGSKLGSSVERGGKNTMGSRGSESQESLKKADMNKLTLGFTTKNPGVYPAQIRVKSLDGVDIRNIDITTTVLPKTSYFTLEMIAPAMKEVTQEIPVRNMSDKDWPIKVDLQKGGEHFQVTRELTVRKGTTGNLSLTFKPSWICKAEAKMIVTNTITQEKHEYTLIGIGEDPSAIDELKFECKAKEKSQHIIPVTNETSETIKYRVESDIIGASGDSEITVARGQTKNYSMTINPPQSGLYKGSMCFYDADDRFMWYMIEIKVEEPDPEQELSLETYCRKALSVEITVANPVNETTNFDVHITGEGLLGEHLFQVGPNDTGKYELLYSPLLPGEGNGSIAFVSEMTGEFWYKLNLRAVPPDPIELELFECELGKTASTYVTVENPSAEEVILNYSTTNHLNFSIVPERVAIPAYDMIELMVQYSPSSLKTIETGEITLSDEKVGDWVYILRGKGLPPTQMEPQILASPMGENQSSQISFKNPFRDTIQIEVTMITDATHDFLLLLKKNKFMVPPLGHLLIPVAFQPETMEEREATIVVKINEELKFCFPIRGITEKASDKTDFTFRVKARSLLEQSIKVYLDGLEGFEEEENFTHTLSIPDPSQETLINKCFKLNPLRNILSDPAEPLEFAVQFEPLRPFKSMIELFIYKGTGGRWKYNILLESKEPEIDDIINIESPLGKTSNVSFKLSNQFKAYAEFEAFFTPESDSCFGIHPNRGILEPHGRDGTPFVISFSPTEYGAAKVGKLIIQTDDMYWSYAVKGTHPQYIKPEASGGRLQNKLRPDVQEMLNTNAMAGTRNYLKNNIRNTRQSPKRRTGQNARK